MERDAIPGQPMHVGHRCIVVGLRIVLYFLLQDCEDPRRRLVALRARRAGRDPYLDPVAIDIDALLGQRDDDCERARWRPFRMPIELAGLELSRFLAGGGLPLAG